MKGILIAMKKMVSIALSLFLLGGISAMAEGELHMTGLPQNINGEWVYEADIPNGDYSVTVTTGGNTQTDANIYINGGERVRKYTLEAGKTQENEQRVVICDGKLEVKILGENPQVSGIEINEIPKREEKGEKPTIYIAGDSTAQTYNYKNVFPQTGWGQVFSEYFTDDVIIENRAMGGRSSKSYNNDGRLDKILTEMKPGDYLFIQFGINDGAENKPERYISVEDYKELIAQKYIGQTLKHGGIPVLMTPTASSHWDDWAKSFLISRSDYADPTRELAKETGVKFIDINSIMTSEWNTMEKQDVLSGYFICEPLESKAYPTGTDDHTHLKAKGARAIAKMIVDKIPEAVPELAQYIKPQESFLDIENHWANADITSLCGNGVVSGDGKGHFMPDKSVTRAEFLKMAMEASDIVPHAYRENEALGVSNDEWYCYYVQGAADKGLIPYQMLENCDGKTETVKVLAEATEDKEEQTATVYTYGDNAKFVDREITREEMAAVMMNCLSYALKNSDTPIDISTIGIDTAFSDTDFDGAYLNAVTAAHSYGLINGVTNTEFMPKKSLTRAESAAIVCRMMNMLNNE